MSNDADAEMPEKFTLGSPFQGNIKAGLEKIRLPRQEDL